MSKCSYCERPLTLPPSVLFLLEKYPNIDPAFKLDRTIPRCKHCDYIEMKHHAMDAELPPPDYKNPVTEIQKQIDSARSLIAEGVMKEDLQGILSKMRERWAEAVRRREQGIRAAWKEYWGIWGIQEGKIGIY
ncbi:hypothetical protein B7494_g3519 [Chlorociboria aeruginascens]|nr:hypothetical protein B7494_g3519 [Chlorociboria aeruginascens]